MNKKSHMFNAGDKFGRWTVIKYSKLDKHHRRMWLCKCECGCTKDVLAHLLFNGDSKSCGCLAKELAKKQNTKHGLYKERLFGIFKEIKNRCENQKNWRYKFYGARGIKLHPDWQNNPKEFIKWINENLGERPTVKHSLDRIDNNGNYEPGNLRWADTKTQSQNRSCAKLTKEKAAEIRSSKLSTTELMDKYKVSRSQIRDVINNKAWVD